MPRKIDATVAYFVGQVDHGLCFGAINTGLAKSLGAGGDDGVHVHHAAAGVDDASVDRRRGARREELMRDRSYERRKTVIDGRRATS